MNSDQIFSFVRSILKIGGTLAIAHGYGDGQTWQEVGGGILALVGLLLSHLKHGDNPDKQQPLKFGLMLACLVSLAGGGCSTAMTSGKIISITHRFLGIDVETSSMSANGSPTVRFGFGSSVIQFIPTSTNGLVLAPRYMNAFDTKSTANPLDVSIRENTGSGDVYIGGANDTSKAIVPGLYTPLNLSTNR